VIAERISVLLGRCRYTKLDRVPGTAREMRILAAKLREEASLIRDIADWLDILAEEEEGD
jgi:hypothetical protein